MAYPTIAVLDTAINNIYAALTQRKYLPRARVAVDSLQGLRQALEEAYVVDQTVAITDTTDASPTAAFLVGGQVGAAFGRACVAGDTFATSGGTADFTDNALGTAKGGAVATGDRFEVLSTSTVGFLGTSADVDMTGEEVADFVSIGA